MKTTLFTLALSVVALNAHAGPGKELPPIVKKLQARIAAVELKQDIQLVTTAAVGPICGDYADDWVEVDAMVKRGFRKGDENGNPTSGVRYETFAKYFVKLEDVKNGSYSSLIGPDSVCLE